MILKQKKYGYIDMVTTAFKVTPILSTGVTIIKIIDALLPTFKIIIISVFVDTIISIQNKSAAMAAIFIPIFMLSLVTIFEIIAPLLETIIGDKAKLIHRKKIRPEMIQKCAKLEYMHIEDSKTNDLLSRVCPQIDANFYGMYTTVLNIFNIALSIAGVAITLTSQIWWIGLLYLLLCIPIIITAQIFGKRNYDAERKMSEVRRRALYFSDILLDRNAAMERYLYGYSDNINKKFVNEYGSAFKYIMNVISKNIVKMKSANIIITILTIVIMFVCIPYAVNGKISIGMYVGIVGGIISAANILAWGFGNLFEELTKKREFLSDLSEFMSLSEQMSTDIPPDQDVHFSLLEFKNVSFKYPGTDYYVLKNLSFTIEKGKHYSFVGANGAGKTTIAKLITQLYTNYEGDILVDGVPLKNCPVGFVKGLTSTIHQDFAKYNLTVYENIAIGRMGNKENLSEEVDKAVETAGLADAIKKMPNGLNTLLGSSFEDGVDVSGGEWQKVAMARNILSNTPLKILDEPTSSLDPKSESFIYSKFGEITKNVTTIFISHRLGSTKLADVIYVLAEGQIIETGTHNELMQKNGEYSQMYNVQSKWYADEKI